MEERIGDQPHPPLPAAGCAIQIFHAIELALIKNEKKQILKKKPKRQGI
jgi:hypothetical protein